MRFAYVLIVLVFLPTIGSSKNQANDYSDIKDPGLSAFLMENYKPVSSLSNLPMGTLSKLEGYEKATEEQTLGREIDSRGHFSKFKLDGAGVSRKAFYVFFQCGEHWVRHYLGVFLKDEKGFRLCFYARLPDEMRDMSLEKLRSIVVETNRRDPKFRMIDVRWRGSYKKGWVNREKNMKVLITKDLRSVEAKDLDGKVIWKSNVIGSLEDSGFWKRSDKNNMFEMLYPKSIGTIEMGDKEIYCSFSGKCFGVIDLLTGKFDMEGCD